MTLLYPKPVKTFMLEIKIYEVFRLHTVLYLGIRLNIVFLITNVSLILKVNKLCKLFIFILYILKYIFQSSFLGIFYIYYAEEDSSVIQKTYSKLQLHFLQYNISICIFLKKFQHVAEIFAKHSDKLFYRNPIMSFQWRKY